MPNDASYLTDLGRTLIAKLLSSQATLQITRVTVGDGTLPGGADPETLTALVHPLRNGVVASMSSQGGEASIEVQVSSTGVTSGFFVTEIGIFATDPDVGEILYTYVYIGNNPEWIRPHGDPVNKLATFTVVAIVDSVSGVSVVIDPTAYATLAKLELKRIEADVGISALAQYVLSRFGHTSLSLEGIDAARAAGDTAVRSEFAAADNQVRAAFAAADNVVRGEFAAADTGIRRDVHSESAAYDMFMSVVLSILRDHESRLDTAEAEIDALGT